MSKRAATDQLTRENNNYKSAEVEERRRLADATTMSQRKILNPRSRRARAGDLSALGNPFAPVDPNVGSGLSPSNTPNPFSSIGGTQAQSFPPSNNNTSDNNTGSNNQNAFTPNLSFPPASQQKESNIFSNLSGGSSGFTFGTGFGNNPFSQAQPASTTTTSANLFGNSLQPSQATSNQGRFLFGSSTQPQPGSTPATTANIFGASSQPSQQNSSQSAKLLGSSTQEQNPASSAPAFSFGGTSQPAQQASNLGSTLFGSSTQQQQKPASSTPSNIFGGLSQPAQQTTNQGGNLFGSSTLSTQQSQAPQTPGRNSNTLSQNTNPFGGFGNSNTSNNALQTSPSDTAMMEMSPPNKQSANLFGSLNGTAVNKQNSGITASPSNLCTAQESSATAQTSSQNNQPTDPFVGKGSSNLFENHDQSANNQTEISNSSNNFLAKLGQAQKTQTNSTETSNMFSNSSKSTGHSAPNMFGKIGGSTPSLATSNIFGAPPLTSDSAQSQGDKNSAPSNMFFQPPTAASSQPNTSPDSNVPGNLSNPHALSDTENTFEPNQGPAGPITQRQAVRTLNANIVKVFSSLDRNCDWSVCVQELADAYKSSAQRITGKAFDNLGRPAAPATFGTKRKEQAEPPDEAPRPQKQTQATSETPSITGSQHGGLFGASQFAPQFAHQPQTQFQPQPQPPPPPAASSTISNKKRKAEADPSEDEPRKQTQSLASTTSPSTPGQTASNTAQLFQKFTDSSNKAQGASKSIFGFDVNTTPAPTPSLFDLAAKPTTSSQTLFEVPPVSHAGQAATTALCSHTESMNGASTTTSTTSNIFGHLSRPGSSRQLNEEEGGSEDEGTLEDSMRSQPSNLNASKSLFDRVTKASPKKDVNTTGSAENPTVLESDGENHDDEDGEVESTPKSGAGDHTWKPNDQIKFGDSINTPSKVNGADAGQTKLDLFGQSPPQGAPLFQSNVIGATPAGSPAKGAATSAFNFTNKPPTMDSNSLSVSNVGSAATSRATTPATEVNGVSASEAGDTEDGTENDTNEEESDKTDRTALTAEEKRSEDVLVEAGGAKILQYTKGKDEKEAKWKVRGTGPLRVLKNKETGTVRIIHRIAPRGTVLINSAVLRETSAKKAKKGAIMFGAVGMSEENANTFQRWTVRIASDGLADEFLQCLQDNMPA